MAFGVGILWLLMIANEQVSNQFVKNASGTDMVVGAKGSPLQLVLSAVYQIDAPTGNIPLHEAEKVMNHRLVKATLPLSYGDNYKGYRIVGTNTSFASWMNLDLEKGSNFSKSLEIVIGAEIAEKTGLDVGAYFHGSHGFDEAGESHDHADYKVVGVLEKSGSPADRLLFCSTASVWEMHTHEGEASNPEITALLVRFSSPLGMVSLPRWINGKTSMQAALPAIEINRLIALLGQGLGFIQGIAWIIVFIAAISVFVALYSSLLDRQYELALMRTLGLSPLGLFVVIVLEGLIQVVAGFLLGILLTYSVLVGILPQLTFYVAGSIQVLDFYQVLKLFAFAILVGTFAALLPAIIAARTSIHKTLNNG